MTVKVKRDQTAYDAVGKNLPGIMLKTVMQILKDMVDPYEIESGHGGKPAYSPKTMVAILIVKESEHKTYRDMAAYLAHNSSMSLELGLDPKRTPSKSAIARACGRIPDSYLKRIHERIAGVVEAGSVSGDSTGYSGNRFKRWYDIRTKTLRSKKEWIKLHCIIDTRTRVALVYFTSDSNVADINGLRKMLDEFGGGDGDFCLDSAYLARNLCDRISDMGMTPFIMPKSNTTSNAKESKSWHSMVEMFLSNPDEFMPRYHQRSIIESVFGAIKTMYGDNLRSRLQTNQFKEIAMRLICYNIDLVARSLVKAGKTTSAEIVAAAI